ncbi:DUF4012 domain-containing protein [Planosporangium mesophilum]|uniref:DUF4012 domain-containing protein n=1 Tax=Planosporangium mesophilum TaxID=689768 RepID=A0A8J3WYI1_9ACTN|nr:DUF4012 domain-containing protein [Planosporangium mesophilum]NJC81147.1 DUF4012 domain-containing protein [Planosporangium mesophilum]GII21202.1 hypothetical protein Pme01_07990 [Planosporangium mesophilum]
MTDSPQPGGPRYDDAQWEALWNAEVVGPREVVEGEQSPADQRPRRRSAPGSPERRRRRPRRRLRRVIAAVAVLTCVAALAVTWVGVRGLRAGEHLRKAGALIQQLQGQVQRGDINGARVTLAALQVETRAAHSETDDPGWRLGGHAPWAGGNLAAVRTVATAVDDLARRGLPPLVDTAGAIDLSTLAPKNGRIDLAAVQNAAPRIAVAATAVRQARDRVASIDTGHLLPQVSAGVKELSDGLQHAVRVTETAERASALLPAMLGAGGPRTYLLVFQNPAEVRATGGMPGAFLVVRADRGAVQFVDQGTATAMGTFPRPVQPLDPALRALYTDRPAEYPADVNLTPDFPTVAKLYREMYQRRSGQAVDGVIATDPVALSYLLAAEGPVTLPNGTKLTSDNAVRMLLSDVYAKFSTVAQDQFFSAAARAVFDVLTRQPRNMAGLVNQLARAVGERRILVWSADPQQQQHLAGTMLEGSLPITDRTSPTVGVFLNDGTGAKLGYYLTHAADLTATACRPDGSMELKLRVTLGSTAPSSGLSKDVTGLALAGVPYTIRTNVSIFSPTGGNVVDVLLDGQLPPMVSGAERRRAVDIVTVDLKPGQKRTIEAVLLTGIPPAGAGPTHRPRLWTTPGVVPWNLNVHSADFCHVTR